MNKLLVLIISAQVIVLSCSRVNDANNSEILLSSSSIGNVQSSMAESSSSVTVYSNSLDLSSSSISAITSSSSHCELLQTCSWLNLDTILKKDFIKEYSVIDDSIGARYTRGILEAFALLNNWTPENIIKYDSILARPLPLNFYNLCQFKDTLIIRSSVSITYQPRSAIDTLIEVLDSTGNPISTYHNMVAHMVIHSLDCTLPSGIKVESGFNNYLAGYSDNYEKFIQTINDSNQIIN